MKAINELIKAGPALIIGVILGIMGAEWIDAGAQSEPLSPAGYRLIVVIVAVIVLALWHFVLAPRLMPKKPPEPPKDG